MADDLVQGPDAGAKLPSEMREFSDPNTGVGVRQLTNFDGVDDYQLDRKTNGWYDDGRKLLVPLRRPTEMNLYSIELRDGVLTQLTDLPGIVASVTSVNEARNELYFAYEHDRELEAGGLFAVYSLALDDLSVSRVFTPPERYRYYVPFAEGTTADGDRLLVRFQEPFTSNERDRESRHRSRPHCVIGTVPLDGSGSFEVVHEEEYWIANVAPSPTEPDAAICCHEGPPEDVDHRVWGLDLDAKRVWKLGETGPDEYVTREYWLRDGTDVGYFAWRKKPDRAGPVHGFVRHDGIDRTEIQLPGTARAPHAVTRDRFICHGGPLSDRRILVYEKGDDGYRGPRELATYGWERRENRARPHARLSPDGSTVLFNSDRDASESNVYLVDVPADLGELPEQ